MDKQKTKEEVMKEGRAFVRTCELPPWLTQRWRGPTALFPQSVSLHRLPPPVRDGGEGGGGRGGGLGKEGQEGKRQPARS